MKFCNKYVKKYIFIENAFHQIWWTFFEKSLFKYKELKNSVLILSNLLDSIFLFLCLNKFGSDAVFFN